MQNSCTFTDDNLKWIFFHKNIGMLSETVMWYSQWYSIFLHHKHTMVRIIIWRRIGNRPFFEPDGVDRSGMSGVPQCNDDLCWNLMKYSGFALFQSGAITLDSKKGERAMVIKNGRGDWAIVKGQWVDYRKGNPRAAVKSEYPISLFFFTNKRLPWPSFLETRCYDRTKSIIWGEIVSKPAVNSNKEPDKTMGYNYCTFLFHPSLRWVLAKLSLT